jgi:hypothetical protein
MGQRPNSSARRHRVHSLTFRARAENGLSFEWLIDGQSLPGLLGVPEDERVMPYWVWLGGFPTGAQIDEAEGRFLIAACSCGEPGCGHTSCAITRDPNVVTISNFWSDQAKGVPELSFSVQVEAFESVVAAIAEESRSYEARLRQSKSPHEG